LVSNHKIKEILLFIVFALSGFLSYEFATWTSSTPAIEMFGGGVTFDSGFFIKLGVCFVILSLILGGGIILLSKRFSKNKNTNSSALLNWRQVKTEQRSLKTEMLIPRNDRRFENDDTLLLSQNLKLEPSKVFEHILVVAPTGTGKSASILIPELQNLGKYSDLSVVVTDPKAELHRITHKGMEAKGFKTVLLKLDEPSKSIRYNLLGNCRTIDDVRKLAESIMGNDEWGMLSTPLLSAFLFRQYFLGGTLSDVVKDLAESPQDAYELGLEYFKDVDPHSIRAYQQFLKASGAGTTISSIFITIQSKMRVFEFENIIEISSDNNFKIETLRKEKTVLYISYPEEDSKTYEPFLAAFYFQVFNILKGDDSVKEGAGGKKIGLPVFFLLDEFANIGRLVAFDNLISTIRSKKMGVQIFLQNLEQLQINYGHDVAKTIVQNCKTRMTMAGVSDEGAEFFSKICGEREVEKTSVSYGNKGAVSYSSSLQKERVVTADEVRRMKDYDILIVTNNLRPIRDDKNYYFRDSVDFWLFKHTNFSAETRKKIARFVRTFKRN
jgi:type IV secretion system protein VirD4